MAKEENAGKRDNRENVESGDVQAEVQSLVDQFQALQQQLQSVLVQKESMRLQSADIGRALAELEAAKGRKQKDAYKIAGPVMVSKPVEELQKELDETKEAIGVRVKSLEKVEDRLNAQLKDLQEKLKKFIGRE